ncbi:MAG TPA: ATP-binding protein [Streptosporangiaceae bacterium]|nr:ATP-binding protein [Streptosporangiaceae bacterium]
MGRAEHGAARPSWPLRSYLELSPLPTAVPCARGHARLVMAEWGLAGLADTVELIVSELVTNGLRASAGLLGSRFGGRWSPGFPPIRMWLSSDRRTVLVQVWDGNDRMPARKEPSPDAEGGRGLLVVEALSEAHGAFRPEHASGKVVWARYRA